MDKPFRRYEMLLPLRFNDGSPVPDEVVADTLIELEQRFGAVSCETQMTKGYWRQEGQSYRDDLVRVYVDVPDEPGNCEFFSELKEHLFAVASTSKPQTVKQVRKAEVTYWKRH